MLKVDNNVTFVEGRLDSADYKAFKKLLGYVPENSYWMKRKVIEKSEAEDSTDSAVVEEWRKDWDGLISTVCWNEQHCRCNIKKRGMHFPTGLASRAISFFKQNGIPYSVNDVRSKTSPTTRYSMGPDFEYRDYQQEIIHKISGMNGRSVNRGIIKVATGGGKTGIACGAIATLGVTPTVFYVSSVDLLEQARSEIERFIFENNLPVEVGCVGGGLKEIKDITVMTIQTAVKALGGVWVKFDDEDTTHDDMNIDDKRGEIKNLIRNCRLMICDEVQHWAAETCQIIADNSINCQYRYGLSATPWRDKGDDIIIDGCFGNPIADISASKLIRKGHLIKPTIYFTKISNMRFSGLRSYPNIYKAAITENEYRNNKICQFVKLFAEQERNILILVRYIPHGKLLESLIPNSVFLYGKTTKKKRLSYLEKMRTGQHPVTIASVIFDEGVDVRPLDTLILAGGGKSPTRALQRIGRILRLWEGKKDAIAVDFYDDCRYLRDHSQKRLEIYKTEEEFQIIGDI